jgi:hypothetical protein
MAFGDLGLGLGCQHGYGELDLGLKPLDQRPKSTIPTNPLPPQIRSKNGLVAHH